jgi:hypothetical protein
MKTLEAYFYPVGQEAEKGKAINLFSELLISSGKVFSALNFLTRWKSSQERQETRRHKYGTEPKGTVAFHASQRSHPNLRLHSPRIDSWPTGNQRQKEGANKQTRQTIFVCNVFLILFYLFSAMACTRRSMKK